MTIYDDVFGKSFPFAIGFDRTVQLLNRAEHLHDSTNYPPYNIVKHSDEDFSVELGVAGFDKKEISVTKEKNQLIIEGKKEGKDEREFVHKALATRSFKRSFTLADDIVIDTAHIENGILSIQLVREIPEEDKPHSIKIS